MKRLQIKWLLFFVTFFVFNTGTFSQKLAGDSAASPGFTNAIAVYNTAFSQQLHLFNGKEYVEYRRPFNRGFPYFINNWETGRVEYEGGKYDDVSMMYNLVTDQLVILNYNGIAKIQLKKEEVSSFSFAGHSFKHITTDSGLAAGIPAGFYDVLVSGPTGLLARRTKNIQIYTRQALEVEVNENIRYYLKKGNDWVQVKTRKGFMKEFGAKKKEVQQFLKQNKLRYRKNPENTMIRAVNYYNQVTQ